MNEAIHFYTSGPHDAFDWGMFLINWKLTCAVLVLGLCFGVEFITNMWTLVKMLFRAIGRLI